MSTVEMRFFQDSIKNVAGQPQLLALLCMSLTSEEALIHWVFHTSRSHPVKVYSINEMA